MNILFMGTPDFATATLNSLANKHNIVGVVTQTDKIRGRGNKIIQSNVALAAAELGLKVYKPESLAYEDFGEVVNQSKPDIIVVVAYGRILPKWLLEHPPMGAINLHASILPHLRGAAPIQRAIINGDTKTGVTVQKMAEQLDSGDVLACKTLDILPTDTSQTLFDKLKIIGAKCVEEVLDNWQNITPVPQDESKATYAKMLSKAEAYIDLSHPAAQVERHIRGFNPNPVAKFNLFGEDAKVYEARQINATDSTAEDINNPLTFKCGDGNYIHFSLVQMPGKRAMSDEELLRGRQNKK
ncbi:MAG: methionyl-tRNA formyltransferase [Clostridiales bacterium]|jgi:methionyl-tRNA formyltransferase|nr:methionyl-tRNA formyltransferase [Clostridiales bacterium]